MKIFISHAAVNYNLAASLIHLLQTGCGVKHSDIFCSSVTGDIPNGEFFVQHILQELNQADVVVAILTREYFRSAFCVAEAGAARLRAMSGAAKVFSFVVPPVAFNELAGVLYGVQSGSTDNADKLSELRDYLTHGVPEPPTAVWNQKVKKFLGEFEGWRLIQKSLNAALHGPLPVLRATFEDASTNPAIKFKKKLRIELKNDRDEAMGAQRGMRSKVHRCSNLWNSPWQVWADSKWSDEGIGFSVRDGRRFRTWIGLDHNMTASNLLERAVTRTIEVLKLELQINGVSQERVFSF